MTTYTFPLNQLQDSAQFSESTEDPTVRSGMEGGYVYSRPRFTRRPRKTFKTGFTFLTNEDKETVEAFYTQVTGSLIFNWTHPVSSEVYRVRFKKTFDYAYAGRGGVHRWNINGIELEEV